ncbi:MAG: endonuclease/exonuclease/phosphatase family protein [Acidobacteria bacterium]|nr:endonuclease/exonuclease/phosphatase family protein [Acidobacteriota bacterium]
MRHGTTILVLLAVLGVAAAAPSDGDPLERIGRGGPAPAGGMECAFDALSWNIERGENLPGIARFLEEHRPALALLQEVDVDASRSGRVHVAGTLASGLGAHYLFAPEFEELGQGSGRRPAWHGQAVLTRLPVSSARILRFRSRSDFWRPRWYLPNWAFLQRRRGGRNALALELGEGGRRLVVYNVHLESRGEETLRLRQMEEVTADLGRYPAETPILVAGDLNTRADDSPVVRALLDAGFRIAAGGEVTTRRGKALDWVFVRGPVEVERALVHREVDASDHYPITFRLKLGTPECR